MNKPIGQGLPVPWSAQAALRDSDDCGHRQRNDRRRDLRPPLAGHVKTGISSRLLKPTLGSPRSRLHAHGAAGGRGVGRPRHPVSCRRVVHGHRLHRLTAARATIGPSTVPGRQSDQRCLVTAGDADGGRPISCVPLNTQTMTRPGRAWCWPRLSQALGLATQGCISRMRWRIRSPAA